jgi:hypothetical protein
MFEGKQTHIEFMAHESRWPRFVPRARDKRILSTWSFPLTVRGRSIGALNLYSRELEGFKNSDENVAQIFAVQASTVLSNALAYSSSAQLSGQLKEALESRQLIGEATGILMERLDCSREVAFDHLRRTSNSTNVKLKVVARGVVDSVQRRLVKKGPPSSHLNRARTWDSSDTRFANVLEGSSAPSEMSVAEFWFA